MIIAAAADGMGGHHSGEIASKIAVENFVLDLRKALKENLTESTIRSVIQQSYYSINQKILEAGKKNSNMKNMGTTLTGLIMVDNSYLICFLGDTRLYRIREDDIRQVTIDHSAGAESLREGLITEIEAKKSHYANSLTKYLGSPESYAPDIFPKNGFFWAEEGEVLLLCTDGISGAIEEIDIYEQIIQTRSIEQAAKNLVFLSYARGSKDNMSAVLLEVGNLRRKKPLLPDYSELAVSLDKKGKKSKRERKKKRPFLIILIALLLILEAVLVLNLFETLGKEPGEEQVPGEAAEVVKELKLPEEESGKAVAPMYETGFITLKASPQAIVFIDGKQAGEIPPIMTLEIPVGKHKIQFISTDQKNKFELEVEVISGKTKEIRINMETGKSEVEESVIKSYDAIK